MTGASAAVGYQQLHQPSPAPAVVPGGENEFVRVSHLASIQVREVAQKPPPVVTNRRSILPIHKKKNTVVDNNNNKTNNKKMSARRESQQQHDNGDDDEDDDEEDLKVSSSVAKNNHENNIYHSEYETSSNNFSDDDDENSVDEIIKKSPYEADFDAERGEPLFENVKTALKEHSHEDGVAILNSTAADMFGQRNAVCLIRTNYYIEKSGISFSPLWIEGTIHTIPVGKIPKDLLLLCLVPQRFIRADERNLSRACKDLDLYDIIKLAIDEWGLQQRYQGVRCYY